MACNCLNTTKQHVLEHVQQNHPEYLIGTNHFQNETFGFSFGRNVNQAVILMPFEYKYSFEKKDGSISKEKTATVNMAPTFCPFCGVKITEDNE